MTLIEKIIISALKTRPTTDAELNALKRAAAADFIGNRNLPNKTELLRVYHSLLKNKSIAPSKDLEHLLKRRAVRSLSGVAIVTSLIKPFPCPGQCVYCPLDERMPKSYLAEEPAAMRALLLEFNPYTQMQKRLEALEDNGHPTEKIEFIVKGGTWNSYPLAYQYWFILKSFEAANETGNKLPAAGSKLTENSPLAELRPALKRAQKKNETAKHRLIGLTLETRPDCISERTMWQMREMGCTRLEIGVQHTDDAILKHTKRGHDLAMAKTATTLLKNFGFKTDFHLMPQLPGATPAADLAMLREVFNNPELRPDMIKIYPCTVVKGSELFDWFKQGKYQAYPVEELIRILKQFKTEIPGWCRISRLIRDIPGQYIEEGNTITNLREVLQRQLATDGKKCQCLRCREVGHVNLETIEDLTPILFINEYEASGGTEYFLSFEDKTRSVVFAFCRLRICNNGAALFPAFIRELHTYGELIRIGKIKFGSTQHTGLGKILMREAEKIVKKNNLKKLAVISGVGVRAYYRRLGYRLERTYLTKKI